MRFGLIGDGRIAKRHKKAVSLIGGNISWICDPIHKDVDVTPDTAYTNSTFTSTPTGTFVDSWTYEWQNNSVVLSGETSSTLSIVGLDVDDIINCTAYGTNSTLNLITSNKSDIVTISNSLLSVNLETEDNNITIDTTPIFYFNVSDDNSEQTFDCNLYVDDTPYGQNDFCNKWNINRIKASAVLSKGTFDWYVNCTDGTTNVQSATRTITIADIPTISSVDVTPDTAYTNNTLTCTPTGTFVDSWTYAWYNSSDLNCW